MHLAGIDETTFYRWLKRPTKPFRQFRQSLKKAEVAFKAANLARIQLAAIEGSVTTKKRVRQLSNGNTIIEITEVVKPPTWQAAAWLLERKFPAEWGRHRRVETTAPHKRRRPARRMEIVIVDPLDDPAPDSTRPHRATIPRGAEPFRRRLLSLLDPPGQPVTPPAIRVAPIAPDRRAPGASTTWNPSDPPAQQFNVVHGLRITNDGLVYVADRTNSRIQVFQKDGTYVNEVVIAKQTMGEGTTWDVDVSPDEAQTFLYVADGTNQRVWILRRDDLQILGAFGRRGHGAGEFHWVHRDSRRLPGQHLYR